MRTERIYLFFANPRSTTQTVSTSSQWFKRARLAAYLEGCFNRRLPVLLALVYSRARPTITSPEDNRDEQRTNTPAFASLHSAEAEQELILSICHILEAEPSSL